MLALPLFIIFDITKQLKRNYKNPWNIFSHADSTEEQTESREGLCRRLQSLRPGWKVSFKDNMRSKKWLKS